MKHTPEPIIAGQTGSYQRLIETGDGAPVHLLVWTVAAVHPHDCGLVAEGARVTRGTAQRLGPIRSQPLDVIGMKTMAERVADHLVVHHPGMPRAGQAKQRLGATSGLEHGLHDPKVPWPTVPPKTRPGPAVAGRVSVLLKANRRCRKVIM